MFIMVCTVNDIVLFPVSDIDCGSPPQVENAEHNVLNAYSQEGTVATYTCSTGYMFKDAHSGIVTCLYDETNNTGFWWQTPFCKPGKYLELIFRQKDNLLIKRAGKKHKISFYAPWLKGSHVQISRAMPVLLWIF